MIPTSPNGLSEQYFGGEAHRNNRTAHELRILQFAIFLWEILKTVVFEELNAGSTSKSKSADADFVESVLDGLVLTKSTIIIGYMGGNEWILKFQRVPPLSSCSIRTLTGVNLGNENSVRSSVHS